MQLCCQSRKLAVDADITVHCPARRCVVFSCLKQVCADGQLLLDLFVNYDCDLQAGNLFERTVAALLAIAQAPHTPGGDQTLLQQVRRRQ